MTIGKLTKKDPHFLARTSISTNRNGDKATLNDFANLVDSVNESDDRGNTGGGTNRATSTPPNNESLKELFQLMEQQLHKQQPAISFLPPLPFATRKGNPARANELISRLAAHVEYFNKLRPIPGTQKKKEDQPPRRIPLVQPPSGLVRVEYIEQ